LDRLSANDPTTLSFNFFKMSAIYGCFQRDSGIIEEQPGAMSAVLAAYGPDGDRQWTDGATCLGFRKMAVTPESAREELPCRDSEIDLVITADVRLDNRSELGKILGIPLPELSDFRDSFLILKAFQHWGVDCPKHLLGDYAFAIWNPREKTLFCARDHVGAKPFYYSLTTKQFVFASDIDAVLSVSGVSDQLDERYLAVYLQDKEFSHQKRTLFKAIQKLPPAHSLLIRPDDVSLKRYWFPEQSPDIRLKSDRDYAEALLEIYSQAVQDCLRTDYPVGVHLSGGLDSSSVAALTARELRRQGKKPPTAFCWLPQPEGELPSKSEYSRIHAICQQEDLIPHYYAPTPGDIISILRLDGAKDPYRVALITEQLVQQKAASSGIRVILSGWGGDEGASFNGRGYFPNLLLQGQWRRLIQESNGNPLRFIVREAVLPLLPYRTYVAAVALLQRRWPFGKKFYINPDFARRVKPLKSNPYRQSSVRQTQLDVLSYGFLTDRMVSWATSGSKHNIVYHYPLLDRRVLEFALGLPPEQFRHGQWKRWVMRNALDGVLPREVCWHPSKADPIRLGRNKPVVVDALRQIGESLLVQTILPSRSAYLDMPRLIRDLTTNLDSENHKFGKLSLALMFLDF